MIKIIDTLLQNISLHPKITYTSLHFLNGALIILEFLELSVILLKIEYIESIFTKY